MPSSEIVAYICMLLMDALILIGSVYLIGWCGWSPWWFVLTIVLLQGTNYRRQKKDDT